MISKTLLHLFLTDLLQPGQVVPLGPIPALHSLSMALISTEILISAAAEILDTRWF
jgi:hypothetical protein